MGGSIRRSVSGIWVIDANVRGCAVREDTAGELRLVQIDLELKTTRAPTELTVLG